MKQIKLFIFDMEEKLVATLENKDANSCPIEVCQIKEALNGAFTLEFELPSKHDDWQNIKEKYFVVVKDVDDINQLFIIQEIEDSHENDLNKRVFCDHASIELADEVIEELLIDRKNSVVAFEALMLGSKWEIGTLEQTIDVHDLTVRIKNRREALETFLNRWGVEVSYSIELSGSTIFKRLIHIHLQRGNDLGKRLEYGHNVEGITRTLNADFIKTALYGLGKELSEVANQENEASIDEENEINEEKKRYVDFSGVDWTVAEYTDTQTGTTIVDENILPSYQTMPTKTTDLSPWTWAGSYKVSIVNDAPTNVGTKSYQITQYGATSNFALVNTSKKKILCEEGKTYGFSAYVKPSSTKTMVIWAEFYDARGRQINGIEQKVSKEQSVTGGAWTRLTLDALAPAGAKLMMIEIRMNNAIANNYFRVTGLNITIDKVKNYVKTIKKGGNAFDKPHGQKWIGSDQARLKWGRYNKITGQREHLFGIYKNNNIEDPVELLLDTQKQLDTYATPQVTYEINEIALGEILGLSQLKLRLGDKAIIIDDDIIKRSPNENMMLEGYDTFDDVPLGAFLGSGVGSIDSKYSLSGGKSLRLFHATNTNNGVYLGVDPIIPIEPNTKYIISAYYYAESECLIQVHLKTNSLSGSVLRSSSPSTVPPNKWTRISFEIISHEDATLGQVRIDVDQANTYLWVDNVQLEKAKSNQTTASEFKPYGTEFFKVRAVERESDLIDQSNSNLTFGDFKQYLSMRQISEAEKIEAILDSMQPPSLPETILGEGTPIPTDWLEGEINALKNEVIAGNGTVTITDTNGILIESLDKTKALRLLGGMLALADEKDPETGEYNWRSFGTGEGFLADLVQTGFIRFERAKGGTLTLGGEIIAYDPEGRPIYENGTLVVYGSEMEADGRPIVVSLNGNDGGFDKLSIGELTNINGTNIITKTTGHVLPYNRRGSDIVFYVDPIDGNDENLGTEAEPKKTVQACINLLPVYIDVNVYIYVLPTLLNDTDILIEGFIGYGYIYIELWDIGAKTRYIRDWISGNSVNTGKHWVEIRGIKTSDSGIVHGGGNTYPERMRLLRSDTMEDITATNGVNLPRASDGDLTYNMYASTSLDVPSILDVYLGGLYDLKALEVFHYWIDGRKYLNTKVQISEDGGTGRWYTIFDSARQGEYTEVAEGKKHDLKHAYMNGRIKVNTCMVNVRIDDIICNGSGVNNPTLDCFHSNYIETRDSVFFGDITYDYAVYANASNVRMIGCEVNTAKTSGIIGAYGGTIEIQDVVGSGFPYAITAHSSSVVAGAGKAPIGSTANTRILNGGQLTATWTHTGGSLYVAPIVQKTKTWTANNTKSLYGTNWGLTNYVYQGKRPNDSTPWYGLFFFNTSNFGELSGKTIKSVRLKIQRTNNTGENTARKPKIYYNGQTQASGSLLQTSGGQVSNVSFTWGQEKWINLPVSYGNAFRDGTAKSLVLWVGTSESDYMRFEPKATLEITYV